MDPFSVFGYDCRTPEKKSEDVLQALELPHQVNTLAAGGGPGQALQELQRKGLCAQKMAAWVLCDSERRTVAYWPPGQ